MQNTDKIIVLGAFDAFLRILKAYNSENFERSGRRLCVRNLCFAAGVTIFVALIPIVCALGIWHMIDNGGAMEVVVVALPTIISLIQLIITIVALLAENRLISETIDTIQSIVDRRKRC